VQRDVSETPDFISSSSPRDVRRRLPAKPAPDNQIQPRPPNGAPGIGLAVTVAGRRGHRGAAGVAGYIVAGGERASMLRVITDRQGDSYRLDLHGVLGGEWVPLVERHWRSIMRAQPSAKATLVLSSVDFIDPDGERLLQRMADEGVEFVVAGCLNRYVVDNLKPGGRAAEGVRR
jgi:hypothetical protein